MAVYYHGHALEYASAELKNDKKIVMLSMIYDPDALYFASEKLKNDPELIALCR
jgi:hypothetical protein